METTAYDFSMVRPQKNIAREEVLKTKILTSPSKAALMFPSGHASCIREAMKQGYIDENTKIVAIEFDKNIVHLVQTAIESCGIKKFIIINKPANKVTSKEIKSFLGLTGFIDYAFFDFCGAQTDQNVLWINEVTKNCFANKAHIAFTYVISPRYCKTFSVNDPLIDDNFYIESPTDLTDKGDNDNAIYLSNNIPNKAMWNIWLSNMSIMNKYNNITNDKAFTYRDTNTNMIAISFDCEKTNKENPIYKDFKSSFINSLVYNVSDENVINDFIETFNLPKSTLTKTPEHMKPQKWAWSKHNSNGIKK